MSVASTAEPSGTVFGVAGTATTVVVGLGNPLLGDDGVAWRVAAAVGRALDGEDEYAVDCLAVGGLSLMERLVGSRRAVIVDAVVTGRDPVGTVRTFELASMPARAGGHLDSTHDVTLLGALEAGRTLGAALPEDITIVTIEAERVDEFLEALTPAVAAAIPIALEHVLAVVDGP